MTLQKGNRSRVVWTIVGVLVLAVVAGLLWGLPRTGSAGSGAAPVDKQLYQGSTPVRSALAFIGAPQEEADKLLAMVERKGGKLAEGPALSLANQVFSLRRSRDVGLFRSLLSSGTKVVLEAPEDGMSMAHAMARQIEDGQFLHGDRDAKFFVTYRGLSENERAELRSDRSLMFPETPSACVVFYHYAEPRSMLIGTTFHLVEEGGTLRLVFAERRPTVK